MRWHALTAEAVARELGASFKEGLSQPEAAARLLKYGANELPQAPATSPLKLFLAQFSSLIVWVLFVAALVSGLLQEWVDAAAILAIVVLNAILGFIQEFRAERSLEALKQTVVVTAVVVREGALVSLPARELVTGDLIELEAGDRVPADARVVYAAGFQTQEASLTGESTPVAKSADSIPETEVSLGDRCNMLYMGTNAVSGKARAVVVQTGIHTEIGKIAALIRQAEQAEREQTPLQRRLEQLGRTLLWLSLLIVSLVFSLGIVRGVPAVTMFLTAVSLAVAAIPEGLPAVVTITLALGVTRMVKRHALIRRLPAVETLGSTTVICTDKTGTLTKNEMTVTALFLNGRRLTVTGEGYARAGEILSSDGPVKLETSPGLAELLRASVLCNGAELRPEGTRWTVLGDPTEGALLVAAAKAGFWKFDLEREAPFLGEVPFDPQRKKMTIVRHTPSGPSAYVKGAPDVLLSDCRWWMTAEGKVELLTDEVRREIHDANRQLASQALRVLGIAVRLLNRPSGDYSASVLERELTFVGLMGMKDPIRPEAKVAVEACRAAGVRTVMITGDHKDTATAIAAELGLMKPGTKAISGSELDRLSDADLAEQVEKIVVYARVSAEHKLRIVRAWKKRGAVVAMTGDGVNDAPAIKAADIGIAMGLSGTDVTREAAAMVVTDDNFASIAAAVEEGRAIYDNILKAVHYLLSCNISEVLVMLLAALLGLPLPLLPVQILWINLVTDGLPALALAVDLKDPELMRRSPRHSEAGFLERKRIALMFAQGLFMAVVTIITFAYSLYGKDESIEQARTVTFMVLIGAQLAHAFNCRSDRLSLFRIGLLTNKPLVWTVAASSLLQVGLLLNPWTREVFKLASFEPEHWLWVLGTGGLMLVAMEIWKAGRSRSKRKR